LEEERMQNLLRRLWHDEGGQDLVEYALLVTLIGLTAIISMKAFAIALSALFSTASSSLTVAS
jgi:Flp pilus assembly pilin Flp